LADILSKKDSNKKNDRLFTVPMLMGLLTLIIVIVIGSYVMWTMKDEIESHPDINEVYGPPVVTDIRPVAVMIVAAAIIISVLLLTKDVDDELFEVEKP